MIDPVIVNQNYPAMDELPLGEYAFPGPLRDQLVVSIVDGTKTPTSYLDAERLLSGEPLPRQGERKLVVDSHNKPVCNSNQRGSHRPARGRDRRPCDRRREGYRNADERRAGHKEFWASPEFIESVGRIEINDDTPVARVRFDVDRAYPVYTPRPFDSAG